MDLLDRFAFALVLVLTGALFLAGFGIALQETAVVLVGAGVMVLVLAAGLLNLAVVRGAGS